MPSQLYKDIIWLEDDAEDTANKEDLKRLASMEV